MMMLLLCEVLRAVFVRTWRHTLVWIRQHVERHLWNSFRPSIKHQKQGQSSTSGACQLTRI